MLKCHKVQCDIRATKIIAVVGNFNRMEMRYPKLLYGTLPSTVVGLAAITAYQRKYVGHALFLDYIKLVVIGYPCSELSIRPL